MLRGFWEKQIPARSVSWYDACLYANWVSKQIGRDTVYNTLTSREEPEDDDYRILYRGYSKRCEWLLPAHRGGMAVCSGWWGEGRTEWAGTSVEDSLRFYANTTAVKMVILILLLAKNYRPNQLGLV
ncbi:MAG: SUMF1/EgtB/PvdO family nonheme iron enzyme [Lewinellaceae bacterium]|nr:SUMF1/EgtB/PvdO family nonheme iron enzyme [Lewinellaceae bacterium]